MEHTKHDVTLEEMRAEMLDTIFSGQEIIMNEPDPKERQHWENYLSACMRFYAGFTDEFAEAERAQKEIELKMAQIEQEKELKQKELELKEREIADKEANTALRASELAIEKDKLALAQLVETNRSAEIANQHVLEQRKLDLEERRIEEDAKQAKMQAIVKCVTIGVIAAALIISLLIGVAEFNAMMVYQQTGVWRSVKTAFDVGGGNGLISLATKLV